MGEISLLDRGEKGQTRAVALVSRGILCAKEWKEKKRERMTTMRRKGTIEKEKLTEETSTPALVHTWRYSNRDWFPLSLRPQLPPTIRPPPPIGWTPSPHSSTLRLSLSLSLVARAHEPSLLVPSNGRTSVPSTPLPTPPLANYPHPFLSIAAFSVFVSLCRTLHAPSFPSSPPRLDI